MTGEKRFLPSEFLFFESVTELCDIGPAVDRLHVGGLELDQPLTVVLPMHNQERQLRSSVLDILDLTAAMPRPTQIVIVDDGSTDETYETACELARQFPQLTVFRQPFHQGVGAALELVRHRLPVEMVLVHDGISAIDAAQLQAMLTMDNASQSADEADAPLSSSASQSYGSRRFAAVRALHDRMEQAHRSATCFRWIQLEKPIVPRRCQVPNVVDPQTEMSTTVAPVYLANLPLGMSPLPQD